MRERLTTEKVNERLAPRHIKMLDKYVNQKTINTFECELGHQWRVQAGCVIYESGCPYCANKKILCGFNDMWTTNPSVASLLADPEDGYKYTACSGMKVLFKCPNCGNESLKTISDVKQYGFSCPVCGDGVSYPNKFMRSVLSQLGIEFKPEYKIDGKFFDDYFIFAGKEYLIEVDGKQHRNNGFLRDDISNDKIKNEIAKNHNLNLIRVKAYNPCLDYMRENIIASMGSLFDFSSVDWEQADKYATKSNLIKEVADLWNSGCKKTREISKQIGVGLSSTITYLHKAADFGWCDYTPEESTRINAAHFYKAMTSEVETEVINLYNEGLTIPDIMKKLDYGRKPIERIIKKADENGICKYDSYADRIKTIRRWHCKCIYTDNGIFFDSIRSANKYFNVKSEVSGVLNGYQKCLKGNIHVRLATPEEKEKYLPLMNDEGYYKVA